MKAIPHAQPYLRFHPALHGIVRTGRDPGLGWDSIRLGTTSQAEAVRIFNIDAPEIDGQCPYESDLALQSKVRLAELLEGQRVEILRQGTDRYGRTLAAVHVEGQDVGDILVSEGLARTWTGRREPWC